jgi:hypothetical protein
MDSVHKPTLANLPPPDERTEYGCSNADTPRGRDVRVLPLFSAASEGAEWQSGDVAAVRGAGSDVRVSEVGASERRGESEMIGSKGYDGRNRDNPTEPNLSHL